MARIRTLKPSFWSDPQVASLRRDARLLLVGLISFADDEGRFLASTAAIAGYVFPHDDLPTRTVRQWRDEIEKTGIAQFYVIDGCEYGWFPNWSKHQKVNRAYPSAIPAPPSFTEDSVNNPRGDH
jgi:hypothetical protein